MSLFYLSIILTILSSVAYHVAARITPTQVSPFITLAVTYLVAAVACAALSLAVFPPKNGLREALAEVNWTAIALALAVLGLEVGFLLAYRAGWDISLAAPVTQVTGSLILIPIGLIWFKEQLSTANLVGILLCLIGLVLINAR